MSGHNDVINGAISESRPADGLATDSEFPVEFANGIARLESYNKHLYRPNTYLHKWWARRCGSTFRLILKNLVDDPDRRDYYAPEGLEGKIILDPMMGGGTTLHEAIRLGANVIGVDIDPVPILQARATLSHVPLEQLEENFGTFYQSLHSKLPDLFCTSCPECDEKSEAMFLLYGRKQACSCGYAVLIDSKILRHESDGSLIKICDICGEIFHLSHEMEQAPHGCEGQRLPYSLLEKSAKLCPQCEKPLLEMKSIPFYARYVPVAVAGQCADHGLFFKRPEAADLASIERANEHRLELPFHPAADFDIEPGPKSIDLLRHGVPSYLDLFSSRQLIYLSTAIELLKVYEDLPKLNLGMLVSTSTEFNAMLCGYKGSGKRRPGAIRHVFSHHAYSFPYTAVENNPLYPQKRSGTLQALFHARIRRAKKWAANPRERKIVAGMVKDIIEMDGEVDYGREVIGPNQLEDGARKFLLLQGSAIKLDLESNSVDHIVTDPPYFDNVQYSDLSIFFRIWLRRIFARQTGLDYDLSGSAAEPQVKGNGQFEATLRGIFCECHRVLKKDGGRLVFTFHHWNPKAWSALTMALKESGFKLLNKYIIHAENPASVHIANLNSLEHDAVLFLGSAATSESIGWNLPETIETSSSQAFVDGCAEALGWMLEAGIRPARVDEMWQRLLA